MTVKEELVKETIRFLQYRPRFTQELINRLHQYSTQKLLGDCSTAINEIILEFSQQHFLNDLDLATNLAQSQLKSHFKGPKFVSCKLRYYGVSQEIIRQVLQEQFTPEAQKEVISQYLLRQHLSPIKAYKRLLSRGFDPHLLSQVIDVYPPQR